MVPKRRPKSDYTGELAKPLASEIPELPAVGLCRPLQGDLEQWWERHGDLRRELSRRLDLLADHHSVERGDWQRLALKLALAHVPAFQFSDKPRGRRGRTAMWTFAHLLKLLADISEVKSVSGLNDKDACKFIATNADYAGEWGPPANHKGALKQWVETLERRLQHAKRAQRLVPIVTELVATGILSAAIFLPKANEA